jgi:hypothetical protein
LHRRRGCGINGRFTDAVALFSGIDTGAEPWVAEVWLLTEW